MKFQRGSLWMRTAGRMASLLVIMLLGCLAASAEPPGKVTRAFAIDQRVFPPGGHVDKAAFGTLSAEERELLIWYLWSLDDTVRLAILGDSKAREMVVADFLDTKKMSSGYSALQALKDPKVIPMIGEELFKDEKLKQHGDVGIMPIQDIVRNVMLHALGNSAEFNEAVINWARRMDEDNWSDANGIAIMRDWYRANEAKLKAWDFKAVEPGAEPPDRKVSAPAGGAPSSLPSDSKPATAPVSFPGNVQSPESSRNVYAWIAALLLTICGSLAWLLKRKRI